jgi:quinol monooxygenase YgiN
MIVIAAMITIAEGKGAEFEAGYRELAPKVLKDPGAIAYVLHRDLKDPDKFFFYEQYADEKAVKYHSIAPHVKEFFKTIGPIMIGPPQIGHYTEV